MYVEDALLFKVYRITEASADRERLAGKRGGKEGAEEQGKKARQ